MKELNKAPYEPDSDRGGCASQGTEHVKGKKHFKKVQYVDITNEDVYRRFCKAIGRSVPDFHATSPLHDLKDYTDECGGNGDLTIKHFEAAATPLFRQDQDIPRPIKCAERNVSSSPFAKVTPTDTTPMVGGRKCKVRMLCCWADKTTCNGCIRKNCPFAHYPEAEADLYALMPCTFAAKAGGCMWPP